MSGELIKKITEGIATVASQKSEVEIIAEYDASKLSDATPHQLVFFLKPELTTDKTIKLDAVLANIFKLFDEKKISIGAIKVLGGDYLKKNDIMIEHYGVIADISKNGRKVISESAEKTLKEKFGDLLDAGVSVLGGHEFLAKFPEFNASSLNCLNDNLGATRLAGGTYLMKVKYLGETYLVLNPFHAYQLVPYTNPGQCIVVFEINSAAKWEDLRNNVCGVTDPSAGAKGSIRNDLFTNQATYGLGEVTKGTNGVHMSAGPLEAMVELKRFFNVTVAETAFGKALTAKGVTAEGMKKLEANENFEDNGNQTSAFDLTEEKDAAESVDILAAKL